MTAIQQTQGPDQTSRPVVRRQHIRIAIIAVSIAVAAIGVAVIFAQGRR